MSTPRSQSKPYLWFRLHTETPVDPDEAPMPRAPWNRVPDDKAKWGDGDHYVGYLHDYDVSEDGRRIRVDLRPMIRVRWDAEKKVRWTPIRKYGPYVLEFEDCVRIGNLGKSRDRFRSGKDLIILSYDEIDEKIVSTMIDETKEVT